MIIEKENNTHNPFGYKLEYYEQGTLIGTLDYSHIYDRIEIDNIIVEETHRNKGIGTKLMAYLVSVAIQKRAQNITLEVRISNTPARNLYKKFGFNEIALRKYYYGDEDGILMKKEVM